jgi:hypothetical protein
MNIPALGYERDSPVSARNNQTGTVVYTWGHKFESQHGQTVEDKLSLYAQARDHQDGPYEYGRQCRLRQEAVAQYRPLLEFFQSPTIDSIYVYNQGFYNTTLVGYGRDQDSFYRGPSFREIRRIVENPRARTYLDEGLYFENFCEVLYCLSESEKPVFALTRRAEGGELVESRMYGGPPLNIQFQQNLIGGRKRRLTKKKTRRSQKSRRRTQ